MYNTDQLWDQRVNDQGHKVNTFYTLNVPRQMLID